MSEQLHRREEAGDGLRRLARAHLEDALERAGERDREVVHDLRKDCKQVRALLRLLRGELGDALYRRENARLRDLARPLGEVRDAQALVGALEKLREHFRRDLRPRAFGKLQRALREELRKRERTALGAQRGLQRATAALRRALAQTEAWPLQHRGWKAFSPGLRRTYAQGRAAFERAQETQRDEDLHEWRKQAKYLRAELDAVEKMAPALIGGLSDGLHELSDALGDDHDLSVLAATLSARHREVLPPEERSALLGLIFRRRHELQQQALKLGRRLYAEPQRLFTRSLHEHWRAWRDAESPRAPAH